MNTLGVKHAGAPLKQVVVANVQGASNWQNFRELKFMERFKLRQPLSFCPKKLSYSLRSSCGREFSGVTAAVSKFKVTTGFNLYSEKETVNKTCEIATEGDQQEVIKETEEDTQLSAEEEEMFKTLLNHATSIEDLRSYRRPPLGTVVFEVAHVSVTAVLIYFALKTVEEPVQYLWRKLRMRGAVDEEDEEETHEVSSSAKSSAHKAESVPAVPTEYRKSQQRKPKDDFIDVNPTQEEPPPTTDPSYDPETGATRVPPSETTANRDFWKDLSHVCAVNISDNVVNGLMKVDMSPPGFLTDDEGVEQSAYHLIAFEDAEEAQKFCWMLCGQEYDTSKAFSPEIVPTPEVQEKISLEGCTSITVLKKNEIDLSPGRGLKEVMVEISQIGGADMWTTYFRQLVRNGKRGDDGKIHIRP